MNPFRADQIPRVTALVQRASMQSLQWYRDGNLAIENKLADNKMADNKLAGQSATEYDPVTEADRSIERELRAGLQEIFGPEVHVVGEEYGVTGAGRYAWYLDPIDGTRAFITGQPMWGTLVGVLDTEVNTTVAGWMHVPPLNETYVAVEQTQTKRINPDGTDKPLTTSAVTELSKATLLSTAPAVFSDGRKERFDQLCEEVQLPRYSGDCVNYALLAEGGADLVVEDLLEPYDIMACIHIVRNAGGVITDLDGNEPTKGGYVVAAANASLHAAALQFLNS